MTQNDCNVVTDKMACRCNEIGITINKPIKYGNQIGTFEKKIN